ncbi:MAG TPA: ABC transporter permease subunit [Thermoanaerobaculia bacterium]|nr:ABC transporter permease subunit [Thermoanaerobaculia bacterium]
MSGSPAPLVSLRETPAAADRGFPAPAAVGRPRRVVATVFWNEVRLAADSIRLWAPAVLLVALMVLAAVISSARFRRDAADQAGSAKDYARRLEGASLDELSVLRYPALKPPWRLAVVVEGGQTATPDTYDQVLSALEEPELRRAAGEDPRLSGAPAVDWMLAIRVVLSIGAFLLCHGAMSGERRSGRLKLVFSLPIPRWKILAGKFLAAWSCLAVPFLAGAVASLLVASGLGGFRLAEEDLARAGLGVLLGLWAAAFFVLLALLVSSLTREPSTSLGVLALLWVAAVIVVPALSVLLARRLQPFPTRAEVNQRMAEARQEARREIAGQDGRWRPSSWAAADGYAWEKISARGENRRSFLQEEIRRQVLQQKLRQAELARTLASVSPPSLVQTIAERLLGSGVERDRAFLTQAWVLRAAMRERVRQLDAADPESPHILYFHGYMSQRPIAPGSLPGFAFRERTLRKGLTSTRPALLAFLLETLLLAAAALFAFSRYDAG